MATWSHSVTGGTWYYNDSNTDIGLPIITTDASPSLSSYPQPPDMTNVKLLWQFPQTAAINFQLPYPGVYGTEPDLTNVKLVWGVTPNKNYGLPYITDCNTYGAFTRCSNLTSVTIPVSVKKIGYYTFQDTDLSTVTIPADCYIYPTSFPSDCDITWNLKELQWANYEVDTSTGLSSNSDMTRLLCFNYLPIPEGRGMVSVRPWIVFDNPPSLPQYLILWYHNNTYLGYNVFTSNSTFRPFKAGANKFRICLRYKQDTTIEKTDMVGICQLAWRNTVTTTNDVTANTWVNKSCNTSNGKTLSTSTTTLFCETYFEDTEALNRSATVVVDAKDTSGNQLNTKVFWYSTGTSYTFGYVSDYVAGTGLPIGGADCRIQLQKQDGSVISPDDVGSVRILYYY